MCIRDRCVHTLLTLYVYATGIHRKLRCLHDVNAEHVPSLELREAEVLTISHKVCSTQLHYFHFEIEKTMICAGHAVEKKDTCGGDSGGPLQCLRPDGRWTLVGLTSWGGSPCANPWKPGVYTKVAAYVGWIKKYVEGRTYVVLILYK